MRSRSCFVGLIVVWAALAARAQAAVLGDVDCDGRVSEADLALLAADLFGDGSSSPATGSCAGADANGDGAATAADLAFVAHALGQRVATPTPRSGPVIAFFGVVSFDGTVGDAVTGLDTVPVFQRPGPSGFQVVVEAIPGADGLPVGTVVFNSNPKDPAVRPDLQIEASRDLGDGTPGPCTTGGVPGFDPPDFSMTQEVSAALNGFGCGFGVNTNPAKACTVDAFDSPTFVSKASHVAQFCLLVSGAKAFPSGDTTLTVQVRDVGGNIGDTMQIVVRVGGGQPGATATATPAPSGVATRTFTTTRTVTPTSATTVTPSGTPTVSGTPTISPTATTSRTLTPTITGTRPATSTPTRTPSGTRSATPSATSGGSRTPLSTPTDTPPASPSATATVTRTPTITPTVTLTRTTTKTGTPTSSPTVTRTATVTPTATSTRTPTNTPTPTYTPTVTRTPTVTATRTTTNTPTATVPPEPVITFFGVARSTDTLVDPSGMSGGISIYQRSSTNFWLVIEGRPGGTGSPIGTSTYNPGGPTDLPYLLIEASNPLGQNPTVAVCDDTPGMAGGVPGTDPPDFSPTQYVANVVNDFACRFKDSSGTRNGRDGSDACTLFENDVPPYHFVNRTAPQFPSTIQFCGLITAPIAFPVGETTVTARIRDLAGHVSAPAQIIISVSAPTPTMTPSN